MSTPTARPPTWVQFNHLDSTYDTPDGTKVAVELCDSACCLADFIHIASIREEQRAVRATEES